MLARGKKVDLDGMGREGGNGCKMGWKMVGWGLEIGVLGGMAYNIN